MQWNQTYGGGTYVYAYSLVEAPDGGYAVAGSVGDSRSEVARLLKTDALGNLQWSKSYGGGWSGAAYSVVVTSDDGFALAGYYTPPDPRLPYHRNLWLAKTDSAGTVEWEKNYDVGSDVSANSLVATPDGGYVLAGPGLFKTDALGNPQWNKTYGGTFSSLIVTSNGGYAACGSVAGDCWLVKTDSFGNLQWNKTYGKAGEDDYARSLVETPDGGYAVAGTLNLAAYVNLENLSDAVYTGDVWLAKTDAFGNVVWSQTYGGEGVDEACSLVACSDGGYAVAGFKGMHYSLGIYPDFWLIKTDEFGVVPEFPAWATLPSLMIMTLLGVVVLKKQKQI